MPALSAPARSQHWWLTLYPHLSAHAKRTLAALCLASTVLALGLGVSATPVGNDFQVNTYTANKQINSAIAMDSAGDFVVVWASEGSSGNDSFTYSIQAQRYNSQGISQGPEFQVNTYTTRGQNFPGVAMDADGDFVVVWQSDGAGGDTLNNSIQGQRYNSFGISQGPQFQVNTYTTDNQTYAAVALDADGDFVVVWQSQGASSGDILGRSIQAQRYNSIGTAQGAPFQINTYTTSSQGDPSIAMDGAGNFIVVWTSFGSSGTDSLSSSIQGQRYNNAGTAQGVEFQVNSYTTAGQRRSSASLDSAGDFVVVWESYGSSGGDLLSYSIQGQRYNSAGTLQGTQFQINTYTTGNQGKAQVAQDSAGDFVVLWNSFGSPSGDILSYSIQARRYFPSGTALGVQFEVNSYTTGTQSAPAAAMNSEGDFIAVWHSDGSSGTDTNSFSVQARFDRLYRAYIPIIGYNAIQP